MPLNQKKHNKNNKYNILYRSGVFKGSEEEYINLSPQEKLRLDTLLNFIRDVFSKTAKYGIFTGTIEEFLQLNNEYQTEIIKRTSDKEAENKLKRDNELLKIKEYEQFKRIVTTYNGTFEEYVKLSEEEKNKISVNYLIYQYKEEKEEILQNIEANYIKLKTADNKEIFYTIMDELKNLFIKLKELDNTRIKMIEKIKSANIEIPNEIKSLIDVNISRPTFGFFDNKKYKLLDNLLTDEYIYKLKTRQIDSDFTTLEDYNDKSKWREFIDKKEREYQQLHNHRPSIYSGSFEEFLQESSLVTIEYIKYGYSQIKMDEAVAKLNNQQNSQVEEMEAEANKELQSIMKSQSAQSLVSNAVKAYDAIMADSKDLSRKTSPYSYKPGPKVSNEHISEDFSTDEILEKNANRK